MKASKNYSIEEEILQIKKKYEKKLLLLPNVIGLGVGIKETNGVSAGRLALKVYVRKKIPKEKLLKEQFVPKRIEGVETDVEETGRLKAL